MKYMGIPFDEQHEQNFQRYYNTYKKFCEQTKCVKMPDIDLKDKKGKKVKYSIIRIPYEMISEIGVIKPIILSKDNLND